MQLLANRKVDATTWIKYLFLNIILNPTLCFGAETANQLFMSSIPPKVLHQYSHDLSPPFKSLFSLKDTPLITYKNNFMTHKQAPLTINSFSGLGIGFGGYQVKAINPDVNGSVGINQYVQYVNYDIAVFNKQTGQLSNGFPKSNHTLWKGFGGPCEKQLGRNAMVKYDQLAHRWVISQNTGSYLCIAISTGEDATDRYYRYAYDLGTWAVNGRLGLWPNAYLLSFDTRDDKYYKGPMVCALERQKMLLGLDAIAQCQLVRYQGIENKMHMAPADLEGQLLPPANTPAYYLARYMDAVFQNIVLFKLQIDFNNVNNTLLSSGSKIFRGVNSFGKAIQPDGYALDVDDNGLNFNHRVVYRQFKNHGSLIASQTLLNSGGVLRPQWYEFRFYGNNADPFEYQNNYYGSYGFSFSRYTASIAMDKVGNIVQGNNISSRFIYPSIEVNYRYAHDALGILSYQQPLLRGLGAQNASPVNKWGTYSALAIDPIDDCTFWYTNAYLKATGNHNWSTYIFNFKLPNCTVAN